MCDIPDICDNNNGEERRVEVEGVGEGEGP